MKRDVKVAGEVLALLAMTTIIAVPGCNNNQSSEGNSSSASSTSNTGDKPAPSLALSKPLLGKPRLDEYNIAQVPIVINTIDATPPFYKGKLPLTYKMGVEGSRASEMVRIALYHDFGEWRNAFIYSDPKLEAWGRAEGARTTNSAGRLLAEAKLSRVLPDGGVELEEFHYTPDGQIQFHCKSQYDGALGFKKTEGDASGTKERDYYFIWPVNPAP